MALSSSLNKLRLPALGGPVRVERLLRRWRRALFQCLPRGARHRLALRNPLLVAVPRGDDADLFRQLGDEREQIGGIDLRAAGTLSSVVPTPKNGWRETWLELPADLVLLRTLMLPVQVKDNLRKVVSYEIDRLTPFAPIDVYFDTDITGTAARGSKLQVRLAVCRRDDVSDWLARLREGGSPVSRLTWEHAWTGANLLPPEERPRRARFGSLLTQLLAGAVLLLVAAVLISPLRQMSDERELLQRELRQVRIAAEEVQVVREELERARLGSVEVLERKRGQPRMTDLLLELTELLPDGTWVQTLNYREGEVDIRGESDQAAALIARLEQGPGINNVSFRSPVMQVASTGQERFHISFTYSRSQQR
jgi:general secretion pathway protein L